MTVVQARTGEGPRAQNLPGRLAAIRAPKITAQDRATALRRVRKEHDGDHLAEVLGLDERESA